MKKALDLADYLEFDSDEKTRWICLLFKETETPEVSSYFQEQLESAADDKKYASEKIISSQAGYSPLTLAIHNLLCLRSGQITGAQILGEIGTFDINLSDVEASLEELQADNVITKNGEQFDIMKRILYIESAQNQNAATAAYIGFKENFVRFVKRYTGPGRIEAGFIDLPMSEAKVVAAKIIELRNYIYRKSEEFSTAEDKSTFSVYQYGFDIFPILKNQLDRRIAIPVETDEDAKQELANPEYT